MTQNNITFERLPGLLGQRDVAECFLSALLDRRIHLRRPPTMALQWQSVHLFPDVEAVAEDDSVYHIYVGSCGILSPIQELQSYARQYDGSSTELHVIMLSPHPLLDSGQSYCKIGPTILNVGRDKDMVELPSSVYYHVLSAGDGLAPNAPGDIQALLDTLGNRPGPTQAPLLEMMDSSKYQWYWVDALRPLKKRTARRAYHNAVKAGTGHHWAMVKCADTEDLVQKEFLEAGVAWVNSLRAERSYAIFQVRPDCLDYQFESYDRLISSGKTVEWDNYDLVYAGTMDGIQSLEDIYRIFNVAPPKSYWGRSLSVSDLILLRHGDTVNVYYCDSSGFQKVTGILEGVDIVALLSAYLGIPEKMVRSVMGGYVYAESDVRARYRWAEEVAYYS